MNALAARIPSGGSENVAITGQIQVNGKERDDESFRKLSAYVLQDDKLYAHLTVYETFLLAAHFYSADEVTLEMKYELIKNVISELGLGTIHDTIIGDDEGIIRGISGGERKRCNIGNSSHFYCFKHNFMY